MTAPAIPSSIWDFYPDQCRPTQAPRWLGGAGGTSGSDLWRVEARGGPLLLRAWPVDGPDRARLDRIHRWLDQLRGIAVVATPIAGRGGTTWLASGDRLWDLTRFLPGVADLARPPTESHLTTMFGTLGRLHDVFRIDQARGPSPGLLARTAELDRLIAGEFETIRRVLDRAEDDDRRQLARRWLALARDGAARVAGPLRAAAGRSFDLQVCLRDVRPDHFLFQGDRLTGLVDFGAMGIDSVLTDLARLLGETVKRDHPIRQVALDAYATGRPPLTADDRAVLDQFEAANAILGGARWVRWHFVAGRRFTDPDAVAEGLLRNVARLEDWGASPLA